MVVDVDGVLSDASGRQHLLSGVDRKWEAFFEASIDDPPIPEGIALSTALAAGLGFDQGAGYAAGCGKQRPTVLLTARPARLVHTTVAWLERHNVRWDLLVMRVDGDNRSSPDVKRDALADLRATGHRPDLAIDDDPRNAEMYRSEGVPVVYMYSGYYDL
ncbi:MAG: hypothetical protein CL467_07625 [Acidimicrobiaceae bacterium]|nr:hypothetical protein [Acidimicrobiaceae bacterium]HAQ24039.1 hypothetical protein [Acidimicrobiaceae bacterium]